MVTAIGAAERMLLHCQQKQRRSMALVGLNRGAGTSTCAHALANVAARAAFQPVLIDLSQTSFQSHATARPDNSLSYPLAETIVVKSLYNMHKFVFFGPEILMVNNREWFKGAVNHYVGNAELAIIDLPAIANRDPTKINPLPVLVDCDGVFLVCEASNIQRSSLIKAIEQIRFAGGTLDGIIVNQGTGPDISDQIAQLARWTFGIVPPLSRWLQRKIRESDLSS